MDGWKSGCTKEVNGIQYSQSYVEVPGTPEISEYDIFEVNGLVPDLEKLLNFELDPLKSYDRTLYYQENDEVSDQDLVKTFTETGTEIDYWHGWVVFCAHWVLYVAIARTIIFFLCGQEAVKGTAETICKLVAMALVYFLIIMLCVAEW